MTKTLALAIAATLSLTACAKHDDNASAPESGTVNDSLPADQGLGNSDTLNAGDASLDGNGTDLNDTAPAAGNAQ